MSDDDYVEQMMAAGERARYAPPGKLWLCGACGKWSTDRYGLVGERSRGWDESCMLNAVLVDEGEVRK